MPFKAEPVYTQFQVQFAVYHAVALSISWCFYQVQHIIQASKKNLRNHR